MLSDLHLGIDVGGTNTDAVIIDQGGTSLVSAKVPTRTDIGQGIEDAVDAVLRSTEVDPKRLRRVMQCARRCRSLFTAWRRRRPGRTCWQSIQSW